MITWTINGQPVNISEVLMGFTLQHKHAELVEAVSAVIAHSLKENLDHTDPDACVECGQPLADVFRHAVYDEFAYCEDCVLDGLKQCRCCQLEYDLTYLFDAHNVEVRIVNERGMTA